MDRRTVGHGYKKKTFYEPKSIRKVPLKQIYLRIVNLLKDDAKRSGVVGRLVGRSMGLS